MSTAQHWYEKWSLILIAALAIVWAVVRARLQSITLDESDTYFWFASKSANYIWYPFPNNHLFNTLLMWVTTRAFGPSILTVRIPALLGATIYVCACYFLCRTLIEQFVLRLPVLTCLIFNPFIGDYMVAARGYGLANAFLLVAISIPLWYSVEKRILLQNACALSSLALALSFASNFSFAFVDGATFLALTAWAVAEGKRENGSILRIVACCAHPGLLLALALCGYPLAHWKREELWWGAHSLREMTRSVAGSLFYRIHTTIKDPDLLHVAELLKSSLLPVLAICCFARVIVTAIEMRGRGLSPAAIFGIALFGIAALAVLTSWLAFHFYNLPLPLGRTGIYLVPLTFLVAATVGAIPFSSQVSYWLRNGIITSFICLSFYFLLCFRLRHFREYDYGADNEEVYSVLARLNHKYGVNDVAMDWPYASSLNFYRMLSKKETFPEFTQGTARALPAGKSVYVLFEPYERPFVEKEKLAILYRGRSSVVVVAVRPDGPIPPTEH